MLPDDNDVNDDGADNGNDNARDGHDCQELSAIAAEIKHSFLFLFFFFWFLGDFWQNSCQIVGVSSYF